MQLPLHCSAACDRSWVGGGVSLAVWVSRQRLVPISRRSWKVFKGTHWRKIIKFYNNFNSSIYKESRDDLGMPKFVDPLQFAIWPERILWQLQDSSPAI